MFMTETSKSLPKVVIMCRDTILDCNSHCMSEHQTPNSEYVKKNQNELHDNLYNDRKLNIGN